MPVAAVTARPPASVIPPLRILVDLTQLLPGGANGGVKPFLFEYLVWIGRQRRSPVRFTYLTASRSHADVRELARAEDELVCVHDDGTGCRPGNWERGPRERLWLHPPFDLAARLGAQVLYSPLSWTEFHCPGVPLVALMVDLLHRDFPSTLRPAENAHREALFRNLARLSDVVQCISTHTMERLRHHYGVPRERMFRTHIAIHRRFQAQAAEPAGEGESGAAPPYFFYPANSWVHKNHEALLLAYGIYRHRLAEKSSAPPWRLVLTGHRDARMEELRALADTLGLGKDAVFAGHVDASRLERLWRGAGALVFPSLHEGFGIPLIEAMEHGAPILCGREAALPEVGGEACLYAEVRRPLELAEAMARLAGDAALRDELAEKGRRQLARFSLEREASAFLDQLLAAARRPARPTIKGCSPDGWTDALALFGPLPVPLGERCRLRVRLRAMPEARRLALACGDRPLDGFDLAPGQSHEVSVVFANAGPPLRLASPDARSLSPGDDTRTHGVWIESLRLERADGRETVLFSSELAGEAGGRRRQEAA